MAGSGELVAADGGAQLPALPPGVVESARRFADASRAASTRAKYDAVWGRFAAWCLAHGHAALPAHPAVVAGYLAAEAARGGSPSWVQLQLAAIGWVHRRAAHRPPQQTAHGAVIAEILAGIRREHARPPARKAAADADVIRDILHHIQGDGLRAVRDRALVAFGMASCLRRSELVALRHEDLTRVPEGVRVTIRRAKGDQE